MARPYLVDEREEAAPTARSFAKGPRGGTSIVAAVTGALVVFASGAAFALAARAIASYDGYRPSRLPIGGDQSTRLTIAAIIGELLLIACAWGGYTAGRMGRGSGWLNGILAVVGVAIIGAIGFGAAELVHQAPGLNLHLHLPAGYPQIRILMPRPLAALVAAGLAVAGAAIGGAFGARWHTALERRILTEEAERREARESFADLREAIAEPEAPVTVVDTMAPGFASAPGKHTAPPSTIGPHFDQGLATES